MDWLRASASLPLLSHPVRIADHLLLDGGITDSIPLKHFQEKGYERCVVVLTQPDGFRKKPTRLMPLFHLLMKKYPHIIKAMARRHEMYNSQLDYLNQQAEQGNVLVIGRAQQDKNRMKQVYQLGREAAMEALPRLREFICKEQTKHTSN